MGFVRPVELADWLRALADPTRIRLLRELAKGSRNVTEAARTIGAEIVNVSHHLRLLSAEKVVADEKRGRYVVYSLAAGAAVLPGGALRLTHPSGAAVELPPPAADPPPAGAPAGPG